jgi:hypothetical protein
MCAIMMINPNLVSEIMGKHPNLDLENDKGETARDMARKCPNVRIRRDVGV